jgi:tight adherence protein B
MTLTLLAAFSGAFAVFIAAGALTGQFSWTQRKLAARAITYQGRSEGPRVQSGLTVTLLKEDTLSGFPGMSALLRRFRWSSALAARLDRADLPLKVSEYLFILILVFAVPAAAVAALSGLLVAGVLFGSAGVLIVEVWVRSRERRRLALFNKQLPVALQVMSTSLRAGFGILESVQAVSREMDQPISGEFGRIIDDARVGGSFELALERMVGRIDSNDLRIVARALQIHRQVGGDLSSILEGVASTMREREELRGHILALTAQQRLGGLIVGLLPLYVVGFFLVSDPGFIAPLWHEPVGRILLFIGGSMESVAFLVMRRILSIEV